MLFPVAGAVWQETKGSFVRNKPEGGLDSIPKKEEYTEAMLIFKNDTLSPIGIRYKGSNRSFNGFLSEGTTGSKASTKLSTKIKINWLSPVGKAILKAEEGDTRKVRTKDGVEEIEIVEISYPLEGKKP